MLNKFIEKIGQGKWTLEILKNSYEVFSKYKNKKRKQKIYLYRYVYSPIYKIIRESQPYNDGYEGLSYNAAFKITTIIEDKYDYIGEELIDISMNIKRELIYADLETRYYKVFDEDRRLYQYIEEIYSKLKYEIVIA